MDRPIIVCGLGRMGARVLEYLLTAGMPVVVIDSVCKPDDPRLGPAKLIQGDCRRRELLAAAGVENARGVLVLTADDLLNITTALVVRGLNRDVPVVLRMFNQNLIGRLGKSVHNVFALSTSLLTAPILALTALTGQALGTFRDESSGGLRQVVEVIVTAGSPLKGQSIASLKDRELTVVAYLSADGDERFLLEIEADTRLGVGDRLVLCGEPRSVAPLLASDEEEDVGLRWANYVYRLGRVGWRTLAEMDTMVLVCFFVLLAVVVASTLVLHLGVTQYSFTSALFRTVSIMATSADMYHKDFENMPRMQVFVSTLRIIGAVLLAAFTAIVTNYLLRARFGGALEVGRLPESGHVVVCGLSTVGFRVVDELVRLGQRVVVIEEDAANRFVATARRLGASVMIGDASVIEVLRQAHAGSARAIIPATNNDMTNLEVAMLAREMNPQQRVVLLINDPQFAQMLREAAGIRLAVSVPALAAPAFVAGLFGDRVLSVFLLRERLFAVLDLVIHEEDPLTGQAVRAVSVDYNMIPVSVRRAGQEASRPGAASRLEAGDRVLTLVALSDLDRLLRRKPSSAAFAVDVTGFPQVTRPWLAGLVRVHKGLRAEEADSALTQLPLRLATSLTRGQAEDLLAQLQRERVSARVCPADEPAGPGEVTGGR
jgi:Trk K+ transport system NAD-binding subunit